MNDEAMESYQTQNNHQPESLKKAVKTLRTCFSSVRVQTLVMDGDTALSIRFLGDQANLEDRQLLVTNLAECLPPALSILGISPEQKQDGEVKTPDKNGS
jgi:hypothetical protein